jgi:hypothetical protein
VTGSVALLRIFGWMREEEEYPRWSFADERQSSRSKGANAHGTFVPFTLSVDVITVHA